jgi:hypothetical protein
LSGQSSSVTTNIVSVAAERTDERADSNTPVIFGLDVNIEELERKGDSVKVKFHIAMESDPAIVRFAIEGTATSSGDSDTIEASLSPDPETNVPPIFTKIYQQAYAVVFLLAGTLNVPYPSPALLRSPRVQAAVAGQIEE